ncbi:MAG: hypothetical protein QMD12_01115 [Candidatus Aenigmarchaeota archaeon]|nr:hypothetical protein [Candidatus Aenigmarchaeota archaeon]
MTAQFGYTLEEILHDLYYYGEGYCENDDKCEQCRHWDSGECALYDEILEEFEWEYEEEYGEEYEG